MLSMCSAGACELVSEWYAYSFEITLTAVGKLAGREPSYLVNQLADNRSPDISSIVPCA
jgi:hypothetical protein